MRLLNPNMQIEVPNTPTRWWSVIVCPRCGGAVMLETNQGNETPPQVKLVFPDDDRLARDVRFLPDDVAKFFSDARRALDAGIPDAAAVELRKTLEAAAARHGVNEKSLVKSIEKLIDEGLVTKQFGEVLDRVRKVGNVGAHASDEPVDQATAEQAFRFTTQGSATCLRSRASFDRTRCRTR
jgi:hypothetical protein